MDFLGQLKNSLSTFFKEVDSSTKFISFLFCIVLIVALIVTVYFHQKPSFTMIFRNINEATAAEIANLMDDNNIPYELKNGGKDIYVPKPEANRVRLLLKSKGLPKEKNVGFEIFDRTNLGVTEFQQNVQYRRALEGELERTITKINGIKDCRVHIVFSEEKLFEKDKNETTATIMLTLLNEGILDSAQVNGIRQMAASSVEGLKAKNITIIDHNSNVLAAPIDDEETVGMMSTRMGVQKGLESYYSKKVQTLLDSVLGLNNSVVRIDALLDFNKIEETEEKYDPESQVVRNEVITSENSSGATNAAKGPPGVQSNTNPSNTKSDGASQENQTNREVINNKYEIDKKIRHIVHSVGDIKKLSVSVFIKQKVKLDKDGKTEVDENGKPVYEERRQQDIASFVDIVKNAIGFDEARGDKVVVSEIPFEKSTVQQISKKSAISSIDVPELIGNITKLLLFGGMIFFISILIKKGGSGQINIVRGKSAAGGAIGATQSFAPSANYNTGDVEIAPGTSIEEFRQQSMQAIQQGAQVENEIGKLVDNFPTEAEHVLKDWINQ